jgi:dephospho-CoA kinase
MSLVVGLTGGIGSGKSAAARFFHELGAVVVDADAIAHEITAPGGVAIPAIRDALGPQFINHSGALDRDLTRATVFTNPAARQALEAVLHPLIRQEITRRIRAARSPYVIAVIPLLFETGGYAELLSRVVVVDCPEALQIARSMKRSKMPESEVRAIMDAQASRSTRLAGADDVLTNTGSLEDLRAQVRALHGTFLKIASEQHPAN